MNGILVSQTLRRLVADGAIQALSPLRPGQIQPSSLDLRLGARVWQLQCSFLPGGQGVERKLGRLATAMHRLDRDEPLVLHQGGVYLAEVEEVLELPAGVWGRGNPKSSTGRLDVFVRLLPMPRALDRYRVDTSVDPLAVIGPLPLIVALSAACGALVAWLLTLTRAVGEASPMRTLPRAIGLLLITGLAVLMMLTCVSIIPCTP